MDEQIRILDLAEKNQLPDRIDETSPVSVITFKELLEAGYMEGINASSADGPAYLGPRINIAGRRYLKELREESLRHQELMFEHILPHRNSSQNSSGSSWVLISLYAGLGAIAVTALALWLPWGWASGVLLVGVVVFIVTLSLNPKYFYRRFAAICTGLAVTSHIVPQFEATVQFPDSSLYQLLIKIIPESGWITVGLIVVALFAIVADVLSRLPREPEERPKKLSVGEAINDDAPTRIQTIASLISSFVGGFIGTFIGVIISETISKIFHS